MSEVDGRLESAARRFENLVSEAIVIIEQRIAARERESIEIERRSAVMVAAQQHWEIGGRTAPLST